MVRNGRSVLRVEEVGGEEEGDDRVDLGMGRDCTRACRQQDMNDKIE
jgi:hypothetical protein